MTIVANTTRTIFRTNIEYTFINSRFLHPIIHATILLSTPTTTTTTTQQQQVKHLRYFSQEETRQQRDATRCSNNRFNTETQPLDSFSLAKGLTIFSPNSLSFLILSLSFFPLPPSLFGSGCFRVSSLNRKTQQVLDGLCLEANK